MSRALDKYEVEKFFETDRSVTRSAMTRLCHHECLRMVAQVRRADPTGPTLPLKRDLVGKHRETQNAALGVVECLKKLTTGRLSRWLPLHTYV